MGILKETKVQEGIDVYHMRAFKCKLSVVNRLTLFRFRYLVQVWENLQCVVWHTVNVKSLMFFLLLTLIQVYKHARFLPSLTLDRSVCCVCPNIYNMQTCKDGESKRKSSALFFCMLIGERTKRKQGQTAAGLRAVVVNFIFSLVLVRTFALLWWFIYTVDSESSSAFISHCI